MTSPRVRRRAAASALALAVLLTGCTRSVAGEAAPAPAVPSPVSGPTTTPSTFSTSPSSTSKFTTSKFATTPSASRTTTAAGTGTTPAPSTATTASTTASRPPIEWKLPLPGPGHAPLNKYGNAVAKVGQSYGITWTKTKQYAVIFVIDSIKLDSGCDRPGKPAKAENGHFLVISVRLQVGNATSDELGDAGVGFNQDSWTAFDAEDVAQNSAGSPGAADCLAYDSRVPYTMNMQPGRLYTGKVALDVSAAKGTALLMNNLDKGWIFSYG